MGLAVFRSVGFGGAGRHRYRSLGLRLRKAEPQEVEHIVSGVAVVPSVLRRYIFQKGDVLMCRLGILVTLNPLRRVHVPPRLGSPWNQF
jgi:hypothetical protein